MFEEKNAFLSSLTIRASEEDVRNQWKSWQAQSLAVNVTFHTSSFSILAN
jgi:hypothetical protein